MLRTGIRYLCLAALSGALALTSASPAQAGGHGHGGGGGGGWGGGWGHGGGGYGGWGYGSWGYGGYYRPYSYGGYGYYPYYSYSNPGYYDYSYSYPYNYGYYSPSDDSAMNSGGVGKVTVEVPSDAQVTFNDLTSPEGHRSRWYESPTLRGDQTKSVTIHAQWNENGAAVDRSRTVQLHAGDNIRVNFMAEPEKIRQQPQENLPQGK